MGATDGAGVIPRVTGRRPWRGRRTRFQHGGTWGGGKTHQWPPDGTSGRPFSGEIEGRGGRGPGSRPWIRAPAGSAQPGGQPPNAASVPLPELCGAIINNASQQLTLKCALSLILSEIYAGIINPSLRLGVYFPALIPEGKLPRVSARRPGAFIGYRRAQCGEAGPHAPAGQAH